MSLRDTILHQSQRLFSLKGFFSTGINDIIEAADTSKGGFYNHFASKEELFFEVLAEAQSIWREKVLSGTEDIDSPFERTAQILINYKDRYLVDTENFPGGCIFITLSVELDDQLPHLTSEVNRGYQRYKNLLTGLIQEGIDRGEFREGVNAEKVANYLFVGMLGASVVAGIDKSKPNLDRAINSLIAYLETLKPTNKSN
jgi:AcrR family transcriptional regulator